jgi:hypothetical protein
MTKEIAMTFPEWLKPGLLGAACGAAALAVVGFSWAGWTTETTAAAQAESHARSAVTAALAPVCLERSRADPERGGAHRRDRGGRQLPAPVARDGCGLGHHAGRRRGGPERGRGVPRRARSGILSGARRGRTARPAPFFTSRRSGRRRAHTDRQRDDSYDLPGPTPMIALLTAHHSVVSRLERPDLLMTTPAVPSRTTATASATGARAASARRAGSPCASTA